MKNEVLKKLIRFQRNEATMTLLYKKLSDVIKDPVNREILTKLTHREAEHYETAKALTGVSVRPNLLRIWMFFFISRFLGLTFGIKLLEHNDKTIARLLADISDTPEYRQLIEDGEKKEKLLINELEEKKLQYMGAVVLGMNDAIIEFTGMLAGFAFAFQKHTIVAMAGAIAGIAAALSMGASEYMSAKTDGGHRHALTASMYTFFTYLITVVLLLSPFIIINNVYVGLGMSLLIGTFVVGCFNFYYSVTKNERFWLRFGEMIGISFTVAGISFLIGMLLKHFTGIQV